MQYNHMGTLKIPRDTCSLKPELKPWILANWNIKLMLKLIKNLYCGGKNTINALYLFCINFVNF
jgi:hypothetical protein